MSSKRHKIAVIPGDGIGQEVIPAALSVLEPVASRHGFSLAFTEFPWGCAYYTKHGRMMAEDTRGWTRRWRDSSRRQARSEP